VFNARVIQRIDELKAIENDWNTLYLSIPENHALFSSWQYVFSFASFYDKLGWSVVAISSVANNELVGIFPIEILAGKVNGTEARVCRSLGTKFAYYTDYLVAPAHRADAINAFLSIVRDNLRCDVLHFGPAHEKSINYLMILESLSPSDYRLTKNRHTPYIDARSSSFADYCAQKERRRVLADARRNERRLAEQGDLAFTIHTCASEAASLIDLLLAIHAGRFSEQHHYDRMDKNWKGFFSSLFRQTTARCVTNIAALRLNGELIAACAGFASKGLRIYYFPVFIEQYARFAPGKVLLMKLIQESFDSKDFFCLGPGEHPYKGPWSQAIAETKQMWIFLSERGRTEMSGRLSGNLLSLFDGT
jgi:CelD/BcsL family acetyltransferase involved in cellulose biosynthesis